MTPLIHMHKGAEMNNYKKTGGGCWTGFARTGMIVLWTVILVGCGEKSGSKSPDLTKQAAVKYDPRAELDRLVQYPLHVVGVGNVMPEEGSVWENTVDAVTVFQVVNGGVIVKPPESHYARNFFIRTSRKYVDGQFVAHGFYRKHGTYSYVSVSGANITLDAFDEYPEDVELRMSAIKLVKEEEERAKIRKAQKEKAACQEALNKERHARDQKLLEEYVAGAFGELKFAPIESCMFPQKSIRENLSVEYDREFLLKLSKLQSEQKWLALLSESLKLTDLVPLRNGQGDIILFPKSIARDQSIMRISHPDKKVVELKDGQLPEYPNFEDTKKLVAILSNFEICFLLKMSGGESLTAWYLGDRVCQLNSLPLSGRNHKGSYCFFKGRTLFVHELHMPTFPFKERKDIEEGLKDAEDRIKVLNLDAEEKRTKLFTNKQEFRKKFVENYVQWLENH